MGSSGRRSRHTLTAVLAAVAAGLLSLSSAAQAYDAIGTGRQQSKDWQYSLSIGASLFAPRMNSFNGMLSTSGNDIAQVLTSSSNNSVSGSGGFPNTRLGFGVLASLQHEFDEELRGGLQIDFLSLSTSGSLNFNTAVFSGTTFIGNSTTIYEVSQRINLPVVRIGLSLQKVFRLENAPRLNLYVGGWGNIGMLLSAKINGNLKQTGVNTPGDFSITLQGQGWGAGGLGGLEYRLSRRSAVYAETGFDYFVIRNIEESMTAAGTSFNTAPFTDSRGAPIDLEFTGIFLRIGVKAALGR